MAQINSSGQSVPHACVICAPTIELALSEAEKLAAAAVCSGVGARPCGKCRDCRKAAEHVHPDIITVSRLLDDKGRPKREIGVDQIRDVIADAQVLPNEAARKGRPRGRCSCCARRMPCNFCRLCAPAARRSSAKGRSRRRTASCVRSRRIISRLSPRETAQSCCAGALQTRVWTAAPL